MGAEGITPGRRAPTLVADSASPLEQRLWALGASEGPGDAQLTCSLAHRWARRGFANPRLTSARPCRALGLLQPAYGCVPPRPR